MSAAKVTSSRWMPFLCGIVWGWLVLSGSMASGADEDPAQLAWKGTARAGRWTATRIVGAEAKEIHSRDGVGLDVRYPVQVESEWTYFKVGTTPIIEVHGEAGLLQRSTYRLLKSEQAWIVGLGTDSKLHELRSDVMVGEFVSEEITLIENAVDVPDHRDGWDGIDMVVVAASQHSLLAQLSDQQVNGFIEWVHRGGKVFFIGGRQTLPALEAAPWLKKLFPPDAKFGRELETEPAAFEDFAASREQLAKFVTVGLPSGGKSLLRGASLDRDPIQLMAEYLIGIGRVTAVAADINEAPIAGWGGRNRLIRRMFPEIFEPASSRDRRAANTSAAYTDIAGQLRATLDQPSRNRPPFSWLIGLSLLYVLILGPLDYWVINRVWGRSLLGWATFPAAVLLVAAGLIYWQSRQQPTMSQIRQVDVVDVLPEVDLVRGFSWAQLEVAAPGQYDLQFKKTGAVNAQHTEATLTTWQGLAGSELGGFETSAAFMSLPRYTCTRSTVDGQSVGRVEQVPIAAAGSKGFVSYWEDHLSFDAVPELTQRSSSDSLSGTLRNPLQVDLLDPVLLYRNNVYQLPTRLQAGAEIKRLERLPQKNLSWRLTRRILREGTSESVPWDATAVDQLPRLMEMLLFHGAAGGTSYTTLQNRPLSKLDLSHVLNQDHAVLLGRMARGATALVDGADQAAGEDLEHLAYCRIVYPVRVNLAEQATSP